MARCSELQIKYFEINQSLGFKPNYTYDAGSGIDIEVVLPCHTAVLINFGLIHTILATIFKYTLFSKRG